MVANQDQDRLTVASQDQDCLTVPSQDQGRLTVPSQDQDCHRITQMQIHLTITARYCTQCDEFVYLCCRQIDVDLQEFRRIRAEQDLAYEESLSIDRQKVMYI